MDDYIEYPSRTMRNRGASLRGDKIPVSRVSVNEEMRERVRNNILQLNEDKNVDL